MMRASHLCIWHVVVSVLASDSWISIYHFVLLQLVHWFSSSRFLFYSLLFALPFSILCYLLCLFSSLIFAVPLWFFAICCAFSIFCYLLCLLSSLLFEICEQMHSLGVAITTFRQWNLVPLSLLQLWITAFALFLSYRCIAQHLLSSVFWSCLFLF